MSEELIQKKLNSVGIKVWKYEYFNTSRTNLNSFKKIKAIPIKDYGKYGKRESDGLLIERNQKKLSQVIVTIEYKLPSEFRSNLQQRIAMQQCNDICQEINSKIGVITDGEKYFWINPHHYDKENEYLDRTTGKKRSYTIIKNEDKKPLSEPFQMPQSNCNDYIKLDEDSKNTIYYIERIIENISKTNSILAPNEEVDPIKLAESVWQDIYINTAKSPIKCLYNVVELFIFKFLSDLGVLKEPYDFNFVLKLAQEKGAREALTYYAKNPRQLIKNDLFPAGEDKTTIINGTIFVDARGKAVESQANLFKTSLIKYNAFGSLKNIKKEFKTKLFETFLKQSSDKNKLGQFFTPRKVVKAIVDMADVETLADGSKFCDPFCGVGGFIAESIQKPNRKRDFFPNRFGEIKPKVSYFGYDKGTDEDDERIIILAKANLLIYLSDIIEKHPNDTQVFAELFNRTFHFLTDSNLGTLKLTFEETDKFDLILTNPPYISSGVTSIRNEIKNEALDSLYTSGGKGVDGLAMEWIIRNLKNNGRAFVILPSGFFNTNQNKNLRKFLLENCYLNAIISLPSKTFFNTPQKTFIISITKKTSKNISQDYPVFTYLVNNIGESLDVYRFETEGISDLEKAKDLYNLFKGSPKNFPIKEVNDPRCKLIPLSKFMLEDQWIIDRFWSNDEKIELNIVEEEEFLTPKEYIDRLDSIIENFNNYKNEIELLINDF